MRSRDQPRGQRPSAPAIAHGHSQRSGKRREDVNGRPNLAGAGLNMAQRVMSCGDAGHILVSKHVAEDLEEYENWRPLLHELGTAK